MHSVPKSFLCLVNMILYRPNLANQDKKSCNEHAALTIAQLVQFNTYHRHRHEEFKRKQRNKLGEAPLSIYTGVSLHSKTQSSDTVETLHPLGIFISYDRVFSFSTDLGNKVCRRYWEMEVCSSCLRLGLFTTPAGDNINHNPSSTTAKDSFYGTAISLFQHPSVHNPGLEQPPIFCQKISLN